MRLALVSTADTGGGAAIATSRLHRALRRHGVDSTLLVQQKGGDDPSVLAPVGVPARIGAIARPALDHYLSGGMRRGFTAARVPDHVSARLRDVNPDIIHLSWIAGGFIRIESLRGFGKPIVWTLHDMWPFTGGCHYDGECGRYRSACGCCPVLKSGRDGDLSRRVHVRKQRAWASTQMTIVATSRWIGDCARASSLLGGRRVLEIPNCVDTGVYKPASKAASRALLNLPAEGKLVLMSAFDALSDPRKGNQFLVPALHALADSMPDKPVFVVVGARAPEPATDFGVPVHYFSHLNDEFSQVALYSAADVLVAPSTQENLSNTVLESLACGTPVVAFDVGGMPDMVRDRENGALARPFDPSSLAAALKWVIEDDGRWAGLSRAARDSVIQTYGEARIATKYAELYRSILT